MTCDLIDEQDDVNTFDRLDKMGFGDIKVLVNNAGVASSAPLQRVTPSDWQHHLAVNATAPFLCIRAVLTGMRRADFGRIVTIASTAALRGQKYIAAYTASKHAVLGLMRVAAAEVAGTGVTANTVCPTYVRTEMASQTIENIARKTGISLGEAEQQLVETTPHNRIIAPQEVADAVLDLVCGTDNGQEVLLDGGPPV